MSRAVLSDALRNANEVIDLGHNFLKKASHVFVTLGTAWGYMLNHTTVTNCHKQPGDLFQKELASIAAIENALAKIQDALAQINPDLKLIYTVSVFDEIAEMRVFVVTDWGFHRDRLFGDFEDAADFFFAHVHALA